jgi:hypothetical protein
MRWVAFFLLFLTLAAGCVLEDKPVDPGIDGGIDGGICDPPCTDGTPICNANSQCVQCAAEADGECTDPTPVCEAGGFDCVECNTSAECNDPNMAHCHEDTHECDACVGDADCNGINGLPRCQADACVQCTPAMEEDDCSGDSCDPRTFTCTGTEVGSVATCEECVSDSECGEAGNRCVLMAYNGQPYPSLETGFCLKSIELGGSCTNPYRIVLRRTSVSGADADDYCGINENLATCQAVRALLADDLCTPENGDLDCPQPSGLCRELPGVLNRCTYLCGSVVECVSSPAPGSTCGSSGSGGDDYCGG